MSETIRITVRRPVVQGKESPEVYVTLDVDLSWDARTIVSSTLREVEYLHFDQDGEHKNSVIWSPEEARQVAYTILDGLNAINIAEEANR